MPLIEMVGSLAVCILATTGILVSLRALRGWLVVAVLLKMDGLVNHVSFAVHHVLVMTLVADLADLSRVARSQQVVFEPRLLLPPLLMILKPSC